MSANIMVQGQFFGNNTDFLEQAFSPSKSQNQVINLGNDKRAVGNDVLRESTTIQLGIANNFGKGCFQAGTNDPIQNFKRAFCENKKLGDWMIPAQQDPLHAGIGCYLNGERISSLIPGENYDTEMSNYCVEIGGDRNITAINAGVVKRAPLIVRFTKFLLRLTIVLSVTMIIYTGIRYILSAGEEEGAKNARQNLLYIILGILLALMSYGIIVLLQSITFSTLSGI